MQRNRNITLRNRRNNIFLLLLAAFAFASWPRVITANECPAVILGKIYTGDLQKDIFLQGNPLHLQWDAQKPPVPNPVQAGATVPKPRAEQTLDRTKKKGLTAQGPETTLPAFSGYFPGYPPALKAKPYHSSSLELSSEKTAGTRIRPPPCW